MTFNDQIIPGNRFGKQRLAALKAAKDSGATGVIVHPDFMKEAQEVGLIAKPKGPRLTFLERLLKKGDTTAIAVMKAPATANRAVRRSVGLWGSIWRWDLNGNPETRRTFVPRYIRRHYSATVATTRRQRRHQARVLRITQAKGLVR